MNNSKYEAVRACITETISLLDELRVPDGFIDIPGSEGRYAINRAGDVYAYKKKRTPARFLKVRMSTTGYKSVALCIKGKQKNRPIHRLLAEVFIPETRDISKLHVNHKNLIKTDNSIENLEWVTPEENIQHAINNGAGGGGYTFRKLTFNQATEIREKRKKGIPTMALAKEYSIDLKNIYRIINYESYVKA